MYSAVTRYAAQRSRWTFYKAIILVLLTVGVLIGNTPPVAAQDMLEVVRSQMAAGHTADARVLVASCVESAPGPGERKRALLYQAYLESGGDSARTLLSGLRGLAAGSSEEALALDRLGDLAFCSGGYEQALATWLRAAEAAGNTPEKQLALVKAARAQTRLKRPRDAIKILEKALSMGGGRYEGMLHYYSGTAHEAAGDAKAAANHYLAAYQKHGDPSYQVAALVRLEAVYGRGGSSQAAQWRARLSQSADGTVFDPAAVAGASIKAFSARAWSIQLGAFKDFDGARKFAADIRSQGFEPVELRPGSDGLYRVRLAGFESRRKAGRVMKELKKKGISHDLVPPGG
ncbi:MAG: SPOR domain-containing protein [Gemmatimonadota bacterium]|nr:SPOR domain-containing protein [Gemmatimonadota bacterium]